MRKTLIISILFPFILSCSSSNYENNSSDESYITEVAKEFDNTEIGTVKAFINDLGNQNYQAAYEKSKVKAWGNFEKFNSTKAFGGIVKTRINKIEQNPNENGKAVIYVEAFYSDAVNGNNSYKQKFFLQEFGNNWKIVGMKLVGSSKAKNLNYAGTYSIENRGKYVTVSKHLTVKKIKNKKYSFELSVAEGSDDEQMEAGGMGEFSGGVEGHISIVSGKAQFKEEGAIYNFVFSKSSVKISIEEDEFMWRVSPDGTYIKK